MYLSSRDELIVLLGTFVGGIVLGCVFDFFRIFRKSFSAGAHLVWLQDLIMWLAMLAVVYAVIFITNDGKIRWYEFSGFFAGAAVYMALLSRPVSKGACAVISVLKKIFSRIFFAVSLPFRAVIKSIRHMKKRLLKHFRAKKRNFFHIFRIFKKI